MTDSAWKMVKPQPKQKQKKQPGASSDAIAQAVKHGRGFVINLADLAEFRENLEVQEYPVAAEPHEVSLVFYKGTGLPSIGLTDGSQVVMSWAHMRAIRKAFEQFEQAFVEPPGTICSRTALP